MVEASDVKVFIMVINWDPPFAAPVVLRVEDGGMRHLGVNMSGWAVACQFPQETWLLGRCGPEGKLAFL